MLASMSETMSECRQSLKAVLNHTEVIDDCLESELDLDLGILTFDLVPAI